MKHRNNRGLLKPVLLGLLLAASPAWSMRWSELPDEVRAAVLEEVPGFQAEEVEREGSGASAFFEIEGEAHGAEVKLKVAPNGQILRVDYEESRREEESGDRDHDGLSDAEESSHGCDPNDADTDDDAFPDGFESAHGSDPLDAASQPRIMGIRSQCDQNGATCLLISVATFPAATFQLEHCEADGSWLPVGDPVSGDGSEIVFEIPMTNGSAGGMFRTRVAVERGEDGTGGDPGDTTGETCSAPESISGMTLLIADDDGNAWTYVLETATNGDLVEEEGANVEFYPFQYAYLKTGACSGRITVTFPTDDEEAAGVVIDIIFTSDGIGVATMRRFEGDHFEDPDTGDFYVSNGASAPPGT